MTDPLAADAGSYPFDDVGDDAPPPVAPSARVLGMARRQAAQLAAEAPPAPGEAVRGAAGDQLAPSITVLVGEANTANPSRDKSSDGTWGDARHAALGSATDHNAWLRYDGHGWVRAADLDTDGLDLPAAFERARQLAAAGKLPQLVGGGYLILNRRITKPDFTGWKEYKGSDPHVTHGHASVSTRSAGFMSRAPWGIFTAAGPVTPSRVPAPAPAGKWAGPDATGRGASFRAQYRPAPASNGRRVADLQGFLRRVFPAYAGDLDVDGFYGPATADVVREFARRSHITADGNNVGPRLATALWRAGFDR